MNGRSLSGRRFGGQNDRLGCGCSHLVNGQIPTRYGRSDPLPRTSAPHKSFRLSLLERTTSYALQKSPLDRRTCDTESGHSFR